MLGHLISFRTDTDPKIYFWKKDETDEFEMLGKEVHLKFSDYVLCTGHRDQETQHKCPHKFKGRKQCGYCRHKDISKIYTRLDFEGYEELQEEYLHQEFSIYLAGFGAGLVKCGVTKSERVEARLKEQGADYWIELMRFDDGEEAYSTECRLQQRFDLKNFIRNDTKLKLLQKEKSPEAIKAKLAQIKESGDFADRIYSTDIKENIYPVPDDFEISYLVDGKISGSKGQLLFYEKEGNHFIVPMYKTIGRVFLLRE